MVSSERHCMLRYNNTNRFTDYYNFANNVKRDDKSFLKKWRFDEQISM